MHHQIQLPILEGFHVKTFQKVFCILHILKEHSLKHVIFQKKGNTYVWNALGYYIKSLR